MTTVHTSTEPFIDDSICTIVPTRDSIHGVVYATHVAITWPMNARREGIVLVGYRPVERPYNMAVTDVVEKLKTSYIFTLEDDMLVPNDALVKLLDRLHDHPEYAAISALYGTKAEPSTKLVLGNPERDVENCEVRRDWSPGDLVEVNAIPMGCALWRTSLFRDIAPPWFATTHLETQDVYFCRRARRKSHRFAVDTSIVCGHRDGRTGKVY